MAAHDKHNRECERNLKIKRIEAFGRLLPLVCNRKLKFSVFCRIELYSQLTRSDRTHDARGGGDDARAATIRHFQRHGKIAADSRRKRGAAVCVRERGDILRIEIVG